ncbi:hypothetical protein V2J09_009024 [Rumex salicifolius]
MMIVNDGHFTVAVRVLTSSRVVPKKEETLKELKKKHPHAPCPIMVPFGTKVEVFSSSNDVVLSRINSFPKGTSCGRHGLSAQHLVDAPEKAVVLICYLLFGLGVPNRGEAILHVVNRLIEA